MHFGISLFRETPISTTSECISKIPGSRHNRNPWSSTAKQGSRLIRRPCVYHVSFFVILSSGTWNVVFVVLLKSPDVDAHVFRVAGPWLQGENWRFAIGKRWFHNWKSIKKTLDFLFFKAEHPDSSLMIQVLIPLPIRFIRDRPTGYITGLNTGYITALDMCEVCTEAVHSVALSTRVTSQLWTCAKYVPKQSIP